MWKLGKLLQNAFSGVTVTNLGRTAPEEFTVSGNLDHEGPRVVNRDSQTGAEITRTGEKTEERFYRAGKEVDPVTGQEIRRDIMPGAIVYVNEAGHIHRDDGPAIVFHKRATGALVHAEWWNNGERFEPSAEVSAAWFQKEAQQNAARIARLASPAPAAPNPAM